MPDKPVECQSTRQVILERILSDGFEEGEPRTVSEHLQSCEGCNSYRKGLHTIPRLLPTESSPQYYTPSLKARTLAAVTADSNDRIPGFLPPLLLVFAAMASLFNFIPIWLLNRIVSLPGESTALSLGIGFCLLHLLGGATAGLFTIPLVIRSKEVGIYVRHPGGAQ